MIYFVQKFRFKTVCVLHKIFIFLVIVSSPFFANATEVISLIRHYDDSRTQVTSPKIDVSDSIWNDTATVRAGIAIDVVSTASADIESYASGRVNEMRNEFNSGFGLLLEDGAVNWGLIYSQENDYESLIYSISSVREFFEKNTVVGMSMAIGDDTITSSADSSVSEKMANQTFGLSLTQVLSKVSVIQFLADFRIESGYLNSPYRKARLRQSGSIIPVKENHPLTRNRNSLAVKYNHHFKKSRWSSASTFRYYFDSWDVGSLTAEQRFTKHYTDNLVLQYHGRLYLQSKAKFYQDFYNELSSFYTGNKTLATYNTLLLGVRPTWEFSDEFSLFTKLEVYVQEFSDFTDIGDVSDTTDDKKLSRNAFVVGIGFKREL